MIRAFIVALYTLALAQTANAADKPESFDRVLSYRANTMFNEELNGRAFLNHRPIVRVERVSPCVSAVWTRSDAAPTSPLRRDLLEWNKIFDGDPSDDGRTYWLELVYADHRPSDIISMPKNSHADNFEDTAGVSIMSCQPGTHHPD